MADMNSEDGDIVEPNFTRLSGQDTSDRGATPDTYWCKICIIVLLGLNLTQQELGALLL